MTHVLRRYGRLLFRYLRPHWPQSCLMALLLVAGIALQLAGPQIQRSFLDTAVAGGALRTLVWTALLFIAAAIAGQAVAVLDSYVAENVAWAATNALRADVALHCLRLDASFHNAHTPGELVERIDGDVTVLANFFSRFVIHVVGNALLLVGVLALLAREHWAVGLATGAFAAAVLAALLRLYARARPLWASFQQAQALFYGFLVEHLAGAEDLRANGAVAYVERRFTRHLRSLFPLSMRATLAEQVVWMVALSLLAGAATVAYALGYHLFQQGAASVGTVFLIARYVALLGGPVGQIQAQIQNLQQAGASIGRIEQLLETRSRTVERAVATLPVGPLAVDLDRVSFTYPGPETDDERRRTKDEGPPSVGPDSSSVLRPSSPPALDGVSLRLAPGRVLGLLGRTGSGKTTLARLLDRAYDPTGGTVRLGGVDLRDVPLGDVRQRVALVTQEVQLFQASVRDNLTFFDPAVPDTQLHAAIAALGLAEWLASLPRGLDTPLASGGGSLSAGQAQLLAFVRVFLKEPGLVVLDEASSRLDPATERLLERAVDRLLLGRTAIVIAHRLATVQRAGEIAILSAGRVVEHGPRAHLAADPASHFAALLRAGPVEALA
jgi:ABC-type multidrug transport system fused ATPase/permease subunit